MMNTITLTARGQFTFNKQLLDHMGVKGGEQVVIKKQPDGTLNIASAKKTKDISSIFGIMGKSPVHLNDEELEEAIIESYLQPGMQGIEQ
ncbi:hypothetical protein FACS189475_07280 [Betaproteobacteria bacterium]|nr:hypothetical protein FACS189475_07280 [Betaproteobacteria bacterium]